MNNLTKTHAKLCALFLYFPLRWNIFKKVTVGVILRRNDFLHPPRKFQNSQRWSFSEEKLFWTPHDIATGTNGVTRGQFRLHAGSQSLGCITMTPGSTANNIIAMLQATVTTLLQKAGGSLKKHYGSLKVLEWKNDSLLNFSIQSSLF